MMRVWLPAIRSASGADVFTVRLAALLERAGIRAHVSWFPWWAELAPGMLRATAPAGVHVVHANSWNAFAFGGTSAPRVVTVHHNVHDAALAPYKNVAQRCYHRWRIRPMERRSLDGAAAITAVSHFTRGSVQATFGARPIDVIHNWVDPERFRPAAGVARATRPVRLLFAGNWGRRKGTELIPRLMRMLGADFELQYTTGRRGGTPRQVGLPDNMRWVGPVADERSMIELYQACDAALVPSRLEGFSYAALEAMACGKPVLGFRVAALPEVVADGVTGRLVGLDDVAALAGACREIAQDMRKRREWGEAARERAVALFSPARALAGYRSVYERVLQR